MQAGGYFYADTFTLGTKNLLRIANTGLNVFVKSAGRVLWRLFNGVYVGPCTCSTSLVL